MEGRPVRLPYVDNARAVLVTLAINLGAVFLFNWPDGLAYSGILWDSAFCAVITTAIDMGIVYSGLKKMRARGQMPRRVPENRFLQRLPQNPLLLGALYAVAFAALAAGVNAALLWFFGLQRLAFVPWTVYKLGYATVLSVIIVEYCIFRYVQPDWANGGQNAKETKSANDAAGKGIAAERVKNPLPKIGVFKAMFGSVAMNIALNIIIGSVLGGVALEGDGSVVIRPTTAEWIPLTGLVFGLISGILVTNGVVTAMDEVIIASGPALLEGAAANRPMAQMPKSRAALAALVSVCVMLFSAAALRAVLILFDIPALNFYQFTVFITIYAAMLGKPLSIILTKRCLQADYIRYTLEKVKTRPNMS